MNASAEIMALKREKLDLLKNWNAEASALAAECDRLRAQLDATTDALVDMVAAFGSPNDAVSAVVSARAAIAKAGAR